VAIAEKILKMYHWVISDLQSEEEQVYWRKPEKSSYDEIELFKKSYPVHESSRIFDGNLQPVFLIGQFRGSNY
jgi:hypothetical protein